MGLQIELTFAILSVLCSLFNIACVGGTRGVGYSRELTTQFLEISFGGSDVDASVTNVHRVRAAALAF
jgi:hypothetical protein